MGNCVTSDSIKDKINNARVTKCYYFDNVNASHLNILNDHTPIQRINVFSAVNNKLHSLPITFFNGVLSCIKVNLEHNAFTHVDECLLHIANTIVYLNISFNNISALPSDMSVFTALKELNVSHNVIRVIPRSVVLMNELETLHCECNAITAFIEELVVVKKLSFLNMSHNKINEVPQQCEWSKSKLVKVDLSYNDIMPPLPHDMFGLSMISRLYLKGNNKLKLSHVKECDGYDKYVERRYYVKNEGFDNDLDISFSQCGLEECIE